MAHFAKIENNIVTNVIVAEQEFIDSGAVGEPTLWIQTSYNTRAGVHLNGGIPLRKNFAGVGYRYDSVIDAFIPPKLYKSWVLNEDSCQWEPPITMPDDGNEYYWNERHLCWEIVPPTEM